MPKGRRKNRTEVLTWNEPWSSRDRDRISAALDAIPHAVCVCPPFGGYINVWINNRVALVIRPGYLTWPGGRWTTDLPPDLFPDMHANEHDQWHLLSTFPDRGLGHHGPTIPQPPEEFCPRHHIALPRNGVCDYCS